MTSGRLASGPLDPGTIFFCQARPDRATQIKKNYLFVPITFVLRPGCLAELPQVEIDLQVSKIRDIVYKSTGQSGLIIVAIKL